MPRLEFSESGRNLYAAEFEDAEIQIERLQPTQYFLSVTTTKDRNKYIFMVSSSKPIVIKAIKIEGMQEEED